MAEQKRPIKINFNNHSSTHGGNAIYGIGMFGAWAYYIGNASGFWAGVVGFFKGLVWPGFVVYRAMEFLQM
jgi:hypothetical protein